MAPSVSMCKWGSSHTCCAFPITFYTLCHAIDHDVWRKTECLDSRGKVAFERHPKFLLEEKRYPPWKYDKRRILSHLLYFSTIFSQLFPCHWVGSVVMYENGQFQCSRRCLFSIKFISQSTDWPASLTSFHVGKKGSNDNGQNLLIWHSWFLIVFSVAWAELEPEVVRIRC